MNYRRALRTSTNIGLIVFLIVVVGVILWTTDEALGWNILPDWIDKYAELLVTICSILAAFAVVISIMCSFALIAESMAENAGIRASVTSPHTKRLITFGVLMLFGIMFALHNVDQYRAERRTDKIQTELQNRMPATVTLFSPITKQSLSSEPSPNTDEETARLLRAIEVSTPHDPQVSVIVTAESPYTHCIITALPKRERLTPEDDWEYLRRQYLTGFPSNWEKDAVQAGFEGKEIGVPDEKTGVFFNSRVPSSWGVITKDDRVLGIIMLKGSI